MSASLSVVVRAAAAKRPVIVSRVFVAVWDTVAGYVVRRSAITTLHELDDRALADIGIARSQIEAAVHGRITLSEQGIDGRDARPL